jgi:hypothetical protein
LFKTLPILLPVKFGEPAAGEVQAMSEPQPGDPHYPNSTGIPMTMVHQVLVQVTAINVDDDTNTVDLRLKFKLPTRKSSKPDEGEWLPERPTVRIAYGQQADVKVSDGRQQPLHITLTAERPQPAGDRGS